VDAVRGFALFGVLLVNMYNFGAYSPEWTALADQVSFNVMHGVFETKSWRMFSMLFAFGFALQLMKAESSTGFIRIYVRRLIILFTIGMLHALFYDGDILMEYAMLGFILILFRNVPVGALIILAVRSRSGAKGTLTLAPLATSCRRMPAPFLRASGRGCTIRNPAWRYLQCF
jgi:uncharacterized protein